MTVVTAGVESSALDLPVGDAATLVRVDAQPPVIRRLAELGLRCGSPLTCVQRTSGNGRVLSCGQVRLALDSSTTACLRVQSPARGPA